MFARFRRDEGGVSEIIGFILGFFMAFLLLVMSLFAFQLVARDSTELGARAEFRDVANRVAGAVLDAVEIGTRRAGSLTTARSSDVLYVRAFSIPARVHGFAYEVTLTAGEATVQSTDGRLTETATTFNLLVAGCSESAAVCGLSGSVKSSSTRVVVKYEFKSTGVSTDPNCTTVPVNCVTIS